MRDKKDYFTNSRIQGNIDGKGSCCPELDIWEANGRATQIAPHPCSKEGPYACSGDECGKNGVCDKSACGYNPYEVGNHDYYGKDMTVDTTRPFTVVTQFKANDAGDLAEYHRLYIQDGEVIKNAATNISSLPDTNYIDDEYCKAVEGTEQYFKHGGAKGMGGAMSRGMVLAMSIWWDETDFMQWLDGGKSGPCGKKEGDPENIKKTQPDSRVVFSKIKWGDIGSTFKKNNKKCSP